MTRQTMALLPVGDRVVFPGTETTLDLKGAAIDRLFEDLKRHKDARVALRMRDDDQLAVAAALRKIVRLPDERYLVTLQGIERVHIDQIVETTPYARAEVSTAEEREATDRAGGELVDRVEELWGELHEDEEEEPVATASALADRVADGLPLGFEPRRALLLELDVRARLEAVLHELESRRAAHQQAKAERAETRREILRAQLKKIKKELGDETVDDEDNEWLARVRAAKLPAETEAAALREARRLGTLGEGSAEANVSRTYLEWLLELPWTRASEDKLDVAAARAVLEADHRGLGKVKKRILEYLSVRQLAPSKKAPILLFVGPPGVGKTSLGRSIARALGREFVRISLGGVRDEAEIRGHRRTYVGALPGRIVQGLKRAGTRNPVFMLDEIDKLAADFRGDPAAALLEVLDPEQNATFTDHYLEVPFDLSQVVFIATANDLGPLSAPLRDRMEIIPIAGYPTAEKIDIALSHLWPKQLAEHGVDGGLSITRAAVEEVVQGYTREAGVRNLERELAAIARAIAVKVASGEAAANTTGGAAATIDVADVAAYLGPRKREDETAAAALEPGVATGLAWTPTGGEILFVEATKMRGHGKLVLTGQLGDVMRESAMAALSWVRANAARLGIEDAAFAESDVHVHFPAGAIPKDGPSAGNALVSALVSLFTGRAVRADMAMTGEITLRGAVLPVGGIADKLLAAHRAGIRRIILPERNAKDLVELPADVRAELDVTLVKRIDETLATALEPMAIVPERPTLPPPRVAPAPELRAA
ncbi:MAG TPA: endopeptidase La [Polyangia bacterium]|nr:endopeptidase La [Polyangia bacterium]